MVALINNPIYRYAYDGAKKGAACGAVVSTVVLTKFLDVLNFAEYINTSIGNEPIWPVEKECYYIRYHDTPVCEESSRDLSVPVKAGIVLVSIVVGGIAGAIYKVSQFRAAE